MYDLHYTVLTYTNDASAICYQAFIEYLILSQNHSQHPCKTLMIISICQRSFPFTDNGEIRLIF